ncbi:MAG: response regulator [Parachlamydiales bacterium]|jgi:CheY-like chemotaxis protein
MSETSLRHILVVDDHYPNHLAVASVLKKLPFQITKAFSGQEALNLVAQQSFALILMDVKMPGMNGYEAAQAIQVLPGYSSVPIIFMTAADSHEENSLSIYTINSPQFIYKPFDSENLINKITSILS